MFERVDSFESTGTAGPISHCLLGDMCAVVVWHDADDRLDRVMPIKPFKQRDELNAAVVRPDIGDDFTVVQIQRRED